jgi:hypothetical protein
MKKPVVKSRYWRACRHPLLLAAAEEEHFLLLLAVLICQVLLPGVLTDIAEGGLGA